MGIIKKAAEKVAKKTAKKSSSSPLKSDTPTVKKGSGDPKKVKKAQKAAGIKPGKGEGQYKAGTAPYAKDSEGRVAQYDDKGRKFKHPGNSIGGRPKKIIKED